ncbi:hypothetical protein [Rhodococcus sp. 114MFTsu3.1]|uniref:hypothetical protein n=1 Tax=Rhodococcus sp. 114MFTsu3.1 TaxID=1172184 RepID=UPI000380D800|nr:hypothetical protein [Rhodococcus sp. 114MFTsu3.1]
MTNETPHDQPEVVIGSDGFPEASVLPSQVREQALQLTTLLLQNSSAAEYHDAHTAVRANIQEAIDVHGPAWRRVAEFGLQDIALCVVRPLLLELQRVGYTQDTIRTLIQAAADERSQH